MRADAIGFVKRGLETAGQIDLDSRGFGWDILRGSFQQRGESVSGTDRVGEAAFIPVSEHRVQHAKPARCGTDAVQQRQGPADGPRPEVPDTRQVKSEGA